MAHVAFRGKSSCQEGKHTLSQIRGRGPNNLVPSVTSASFAVSLFRGCSLFNSEQGMNFPRMRDISAPYLPLIDCDQVNTRSARLRSAATFSNDEPANPRRRGQGRFTAVAQWRPDNSSFFFCYLQLGSQIAEGKS